MKTNLMTAAVLSAAAIASAGSGRTNSYTKAMAAQDAKVMSEARGKRAAILSQRRDMTDPTVRAEVVQQLKDVEADRMAAVKRRAEAQGLEMKGTYADGRSFRLIGFDDNGFPEYDEDFNVNAAITTAADQVRSNATYLGVNGSSVTIGLWESGGVPRTTHQELEGRVTVKDEDADTTNHATHTAGTMISQGVNTNTLGMAPGASIAAFDSSYVVTEMTEYGAAEPGSTNLYLSNHSYGVTRGWKQTGTTNWSWGGIFSDDDDPSNDYEDDFGRYNYRSEDWDAVAYSQPYFLIFAAAGNGRKNVPSEGDTWEYGWDEYTYDSTIHPAGNGDYKGGWDNMEGGTLAKNSIAVGWASDGVDDYGDRDPGEAAALKYSCRGPADDGRIKPDIYGNGQGLTSSIASSDTATASYSGTSMSTPNCCGSAALLIDYYSARCSGSMRASTLKALILHTADDRGDDGPDYKYGWGIMNTQAAADVIKAHADNAGGGAMIESSVSTNVTSRSRTFSWDGTSELRVTLCWTDPASPEIEGHDNRTKTLVNDLNLKVTDSSGTVYYPYVMPYVADGDWDEDKIGDEAVTGVNDVDNVEQVYVASPTAGDYTITVDYAGELTNGEQVYSLIVTGNAEAEFTELEEWRSDYFGTTFGAGDTADDADFDEDGYANLIEFGLAASPTSTSDGVVAFTADSSDASLTYSRNVNALTDYDFEVVWSDNLFSNSWSSADVNETVLSTTGSVQQVESSLPMGDSSNRYFRLRMSEK